MRLLRRAWRAAAWAVPLCMAALRLAAAADLTIGLGQAADSLDPHFHVSTPARSMAANLFDRLVYFDENGQVQPGLAESWSMVDELTWEFRLRPALFHDGSAFGAEDVAASIRRIPKVANNPASYVEYVSSIERLDVVDDRTLRIRTRTPDPLLLDNLNSVSIISRRFEDATTADFNAGRAAIGTGPFRLEAYVPGERVRLARNDAYWRQPSPFAHVTLRWITVGAARTAALLAGDVDVIELVPPADVPRLRANPGVRVISGHGGRLMYVVLDQAGETPAARLFRHREVRQALSQAIDRRALVDRIMDGLADPASGIVPAGYLGAPAAAAPIPYDPGRLRTVLAGFGPAPPRITLLAPSDRYLNDAKVAQAVAQMWTRAGLPTEVETLPWVAFSARAAQRAFLAGLFGAGAQTPEMSSIAQKMVATYDRGRGLGELNRGGYSNPALDRLLEAARTMGREQRRALLERASGIVASDVPVIPLYFQAPVWAVRRSIGFISRPDENTWAYNARLEPPPGAAPR